MYVKKDYSIIALAESLKRGGDQRKALNPITDKPLFITSDEVLELALKVLLFHHLKGKNVV